MRFFLKLFLTFWAAVLFLGGGLFWGGHTLRDFLDPLLEQHLLKTITERRTLVNLLREHGIATTRTHLEKSPFREELFVLDASGEDLSGRTPPAYLRHAPVDSGLPLPPPPFLKGFTLPPNEPPPHMSLPVDDPEGNHYRVAMTRIPHPWSMLLREYPLFPLAVFLFSGLVVFLLARHFTKPLQRLQYTALRLAEGDLTTRTPAGSRLIPDELDDLARDFNFMAQRLEEQFHRQKRLLRDVSHELRSPLARMRVALGLAEQEGEARIDHLQRLALELERLDELIEQIIRVSRPEESGPVRKESLVDLGALVASVVADARFETGGPVDRIALSVEETAFLWADGKRLHSAVENIVRNALRHSPAGAEIAVALSVGDRRARLRVTDAGPGVPEKDLPRLMEPFFRVEEDRDRGSGGYGLGLAIAARAVRDHGGEITARNRPKGGLEVEITLPVETMPPLADEEDG
ncbi:MAG: HAMP domain-containing protein [Magnetococcales bacterium]|nr:HAMP domain-containing protein [Magnetococcales bacterium]